MVRFRATPSLIGCFAAIVQLLDLAVNVAEVLMTTPTSAMPGMGILNVQKVLGFRGHVQHMDLVGRVPTEDSATFCESGVLGHLPKLVVVSRSLQLETSAQRNCHDAGEVLEQRHGHDAVLVHHSQQSHLGTALVRTVLEHSSGHASVDHFNGDGHALVQQVLDGVNARNILLSGHGAEFSGLFQTQVDALAVHVEATQELVVLAARWRFTFLKVTSADFRH